MSVMRLAAHLERKTAETVLFKSLLKSCNEVEDMPTALRLNG